ncbi:MAG: M60 family metallopeptidase, partial [Cetobacterium sp.]
KELCVRVTKSNDDHVLIYESEFFKYNRILDILLECFTDETETALVPKVDLDYLRYLKSLLGPTEEYRVIYEKIENLYVETVEPLVFTPQNLSTLSVVSGFKYRVFEDPLRVGVRYTDRNGKVCTLTSVEVQKLSDEEREITFPEILTDNFELLVYAGRDVFGVEVVQSPLSQYCFSEDVDTTYSKEDTTIDYYSIDNVVYNMVKLASKKAISRFITSFNDEMTVYYEDPLTNSRYLFSDKNINIAKITPLVIDKFYIVCGNRRFKKEELSIYVHTTLEDEIDALFVDDSFTMLKDCVSYKNITDLEARVLHTADFKKKIEIAKNIFRESKIKEKIEYKYYETRVIKNLELFLKDNINNFYGLNIFYTDSTGCQQLAKGVKFSIEDKKISLEIDPIFTKNLYIEVYLEEVETWKLEYIKVLDCNQEQYYSTDDVFTLIPKSTIKGTSRCGEHKPISACLDGDLGTNFYSTSLGTIEFAFESQKVIDEFRYVCKSQNGNIRTGKIYYKIASTDSEWNFATTFSISSSANDSIKIFKLPPIFAQEIRLDVETSSSSSISLYEVDIKVYNSIGNRINRLFSQNYEQLAPGIGLKDIEELYQFVKEDKEILVSLELAKFFEKSNGVNPFKVFSLKALENNKDYYFNSIKVNGTGNLYATPHYLKPNETHVLVCNRPIDGVLATFMGKPASNYNIQFKKGINVINPGDAQGQLFLQGNRDEELRMYALTDLDNGLVYRYGYDSYEDIYTKTKIDTVTESTHNSNLLYIEGINATVATGIDNLRSGVKEENFMEVFHTREEFVSFLYEIVGADKRFDEPIPYTRQMWEGNGGSNPHAGVSLGNGYTAYAGITGDLFKPKKERYAYSWVVGHEIGHELDNNGYLMGIFGEVFNNWFAESAVLEFRHMKGRSDDDRVTEEAFSIFDGEYWTRLGFWFKFRYFYNDKEYIIKMNEYMQNNPATSNEDAASKLAMFTSDILNRDASPYFLRHSFPLSEEAINVCKTYPQFALPIWEIKWENKDEFIKEEHRLFMERYSSN